MKFFLLRHAESEANERCVWTGQMDPGLSGRGVALQADICSRYRYPAGELYFSSPLRRCLDSLRIVYDRYADYTLPEFLECSLGELEGREYTNLDDDERYIAWVTGRTTRPGGGESFDEFTARVRAGFLRMAAICEERGASNVVAVLHGNVMRAILSGFIEPSRPHPLWEIPNCGGYLFDYVADLPAPLPYEKIPGFLFTEETPDQR